MGKMDFIFGAKLMNLFRQKKHIAVAVISTDIEFRLVTADRFFCADESLFFASLDIHFQKSYLPTAENVVNAVGRNFRFSHRGKL